MLFYLTHFIEIGLLPPGNVIFFSLIAFLLWRFKPLLGKFFLGFALLNFWVLSTPLFAQFLVDKLQYQHPVLAIKDLHYDPNAAIVVLEAGLNLQTPEYKEPTVSEMTLTRIRYAAFLHQKTQTPILVSGNDPNHADVDQADYMAIALKNYFNVATKWKENRGFNTALEAVYTAEILNKENIKKIYLVTHAVHMPRSVYIFEKAGFQVVPAPTGFVALDYRSGITALLPSLSGLRTSFSALHEYIGIVWYRLYYRS